MKKRLFVGIKIDKKLGKEVQNWEGVFKKLPVRRIKSENLHITLVPPWYEEEEKLHKLIEGLRELGLNINPFKIHFEKVEFGPDTKRPRLIWAIGGKPAEVDQLEKTLSSFLQKEPQRKNDLIHLTLGRFKPKDFRTFTIKSVQDNVDWNQTVDSLCIFESQLKQTGAEYKVLEEFRIAS